MASDRSTWVRLLDTDTQQGGWGYRTPAGEFVRLANGALLYYAARARLQQARREREKNDGTD